MPSAATGSNVFAPFAIFVNVLGVPTLPSLASFGLTKLDTILFFASGCLSKAVPSEFLNSLVVGSYTFPSKSLGL